MQETFAFALTYGLVAKGQKGTRAKGAAVLFLFKFKFKTKYKNEFITLTIAARGEAPKRGFLFTIASTGKRGGNRGEANVKSKCSKTNNKNPRVVFTRRGGGI